ncbi:hypothetical protein C0995_003734 [Termitomyces sp. Mi166|nr:hypothetical protein C0995_003734 [Termitomyces sp. Mi166\
MATFSPSPAPRRSSRNKQPAISPPRRARAAAANTTGRATSRLATPARSRPSDHGSVLSGMDIDEGGTVSSERPNMRATGDTLYAKSDQLGVSFYANLPVELKQVLKNANFFRDAYTGDIDTLTGFALVASAQTCFVWQHAQPPFHALIPHSTSREPGLILLSPDGTIRFWDSIGIGLAGGDHYSTIQLDVAPGESVTNLLRSDSQTYVASTSAGNLFRLTLVSSGGKRHLKLHVFSKPSHSISLSRLLPSIFSSGSTTSTFSHSKNISAIALGAKTGTGGREVWAIVDTLLQRWAMSPEGWEQLLLEGDILGILSTAVRKAFGTRVDADDQKVDLELLDLAVDGEALAVLVSYVAAATAEDEMSMVLDSRSVRRVYALAHITFRENIFAVNTVRSVPYQSVSRSSSLSYSTQMDSWQTLTNSAAPMHPRIRLALDGALISIQFGDAVAFCSRDVDYRERLELKSTADRTLGVGTQDDGPLLVLTAATMMKVSMNLDAILAYDIENGEAKLVKSAMTQAILFSGLPDNPLQFSLPPDLDEESLMQGAQQLSQAVLEMNPSHSILNDAVHVYMQEINEGRHEDVIRAFFRLRVVDTGRLISRTALNSAFDYREYNLQVYGIDLPMIRPWSSKPAVIDVVLGLFDATTKAIEAPSSGHRAKTDSEPGTQLPDLAAVLFTCIQERLDWLGSPFAMSEPGIQRDREELTTKFDMLRSEVFETLRRNGYANAAFSLAEKYRDFSGLASLCHKDTIYPPENNSNSLRIQAYIERFKDEFTAELYRWYIQHGELRVMFAHDHSHNPYIDKYFAENPNNSISWINDLGKGRYATASTTLLKEAEHANNLDAKHLMLSIGKLAHLAQLHETNTVAPDNSILDAFHDDLDFVSVHEALLKEFKSALDAIRGRQTLDSQIETIVKATATGLQEKPTLRDIFKDLVRGLLQGRALCIEDAVDVLTLKDNNSSPEDFATALHLLARVQVWSATLTILRPSQLLSQNLPEARVASAFRTVWRRIYIHDDWDAIRKTANVSDAELSARFRRTALYNTLCAIITKDHQPVGYETSPDEALITPTMIEITSRWPGFTQEQVEALVQDYNLECDRLGELDLNDVFHRVRELAVHDVEWQEDV